MEDQKHVKLNASLIEKVDQLVRNQETRVFASRKQFVEIAVFEKLEELTKK